MAIKEQAQRKLIEAKEQAQRKLLDDAEARAKAERDAMTIEAQRMAKEAATRAIIQSEADDRRSKAEAAFNTANNVLAGYNNKLMEQHAESEKIAKRAQAKLKEKIAQLESQQKKMLKKQKAEENSSTEGEGDSEESDGSDDDDEEESSDSDNHKRQKKRKSSKQEAKQNKKPKKLTDRLLLQLVKQNDQADDVHEAKKRWSDPNLQRTVAVVSLIGKAVDVYEAKKTGKLIKGIVEAIAEDAEGGTPYFKEVIRLAGNLKKIKGRAKILKITEHVKKTKDVAITQVEHNGVKCHHCSNGRASNTCWVLNPSIRPQRGQSAPAQSAPAQVLPG